MTADATPDTWDPEIYERFRAERERPVDDLLGLVAPVPGGRVVDLGCGTGRITARLHEHTRAAETVGLDSSPKMLQRAGEESGGGVRFAEADLADLDDLDDTWDVIFSNAAYHWVPDHERLLPGLVEHLAPGGQFVFQVPSNFEHPSHVVADALGHEYGVGGLDATAAIESPARYAEILWATGLRDLDVSLRIYGMALTRTDEVIAWVSGSMLTTYERRLGPDRYPEFRAEYRRRLLDALGDPTGDRPYYFAFPRILCAGRLA
ncbi:MAG: methyltransferase domain-containing protein [Acidimicrobiales bacterium]|nr:methyltransferase domain-containing protein [Acidimicrobiales bacterium]